MVETFAEKIAVSMKRTVPEQTTSVDVMKYSLILLINSVAIFVLSLSIGWFTGKFTETLYTIISFVLLRFFAGGMHFKTALQCIVVSTLVLSILPHIPINYQTTIILTTISFVIILLRAPFDIKKKSKIPENYFPLLKVLAALIVATNFFFMSTILAKSFFTESLSTVKLRRKDR